MISIEKWIILTPLQKLPNNVGDLGKIIAAPALNGCQSTKIAQSGHTASNHEKQESIKIYWHEL